MLPFIKSGKVRCIATGSAKRLPQFARRATVAEQGFPGFEMTQWYGMLAPANMPAANLEKLSVETMKAVKAPPRWNGFNADAAEAIGVRLRSLPSSSPQSRNAGRRYCCAPRSSQTEHPQTAPIHHPGLNRRLEWLWTLPSLPSGRLSALASPHHAHPLAEDEHSLGTWLSRALEHAGIQVEWVSDGLMADRALQHADYDAWCWTWALPGLDGHGVLQRLRERDQRLRPR